MNHQEEEKLAFRLVLFFCEKSKKAEQMTSMKIFLISGISPYFLVKSLFYE